MTNAEKYLKDGVEHINEFELADELYEFLCKNYGKQRFEASGIREFFHKEVKPILSEDEKVILKKLRYEKGAYEFMKIGRTELDSEGGCDLILIDFDNDTTWFGEYGHLFQFIQPRRRI